MEENIPEGLTVFSFSKKYRRRLRTTDGLKRLNREDRRRARVVVLFPNSATGLRLVTAIMMEIIEESRTGRIYIRLDADNYC